MAALGLLALGCGSTHNILLLRKYQQPTYPGELLVKRNSRHVCPQMSVADRTNFTEIESKVVP